MGRGFGLSLPCTINDTTRVEGEALAVLKEVGVAGLIAQPVN